MAKPNIFISSTYYDLKYIREALKSFIEIYGYQATLNEYGRVAYKHGETLDKSCFDEVKNSDMLILIIGGRYGSSVSNESNNMQELEFYDEYTSITSQEFRTAYESNLPIYIFIERNVHSEYYTYTKNKGNESLEYAHADSINVYKFIEDIKTVFSSTIVFDFEKVDDITAILKEQWAGLFADYLRKIRQSKDDSVVVSSINKLEIVSDNISEIVNQLGNKLLSDNVDYKSVVVEQNNKLLEFYTEELYKKIKLDFYNELSLEESATLASIITDEIFMNQNVMNMFDRDVSRMSNEKKDELLNYYVDEVWDVIQSRIEDELDNCAHFYLDSLGQITSYFIKWIHPIIKGDINLKEKFIRLSAIFINEMSRMYIDA